VSAFKDYGPLVESRCPQCNYKLTAATIAHGEESAPSGGDSSVCINCGQLLTYEADQTLRKASAEEVRELMEDAAAWATIEKAQLFIRRRGPIPKVN
jgi:DNA-directed RNA polymerase subunit RPC12/RpoP